METIEWTHDDVDLEIDYIYTPGESSIDYYPDGSGYPGSPPVVDIQHIWAPLKDRSGHLINVDVKDIIEESLDIDRLEEEILELKNL